MAGWSPQLQYPTGLLRLELSPKDLQQVIEGKVTAILKAAVNPVAVANSVVKDVCDKLSRGTNITNPSKSDQRRHTANEFYQITGASPDQVSSPTKVSSEYPSFIRDAQKSYHLEQDKLFDLLRNDSKLDKELTWREGQLMRNGKVLWSVELCNCMDEVTLAFFNEAEQETSITTTQERGQKLREMLECVDKILADRIYGGAAIVDDLLKEDNYKKWKKHVEIIASFAALKVSLVVCKC